MSHICLLSKTDAPALFCGDTLFNAGGGQLPRWVGIRRSSIRLSRTSSTHCRTKPSSIRDTTTSPTTSAFTLDREPDNDAAAKLSRELEGTHDPDDPMVTTIAQEREINTFFRLTSPTIAKRLREAFPELSEDPSPKEVFVRLRELRNSW